MDNELVEAMLPAKYIACDSVIISDNRQRRAFDEGKLRELANSIENEKIGLLHPIVIRRDNNRTILVAGERRLRAFKDSHELGVAVWHAGQQVPIGMIPYLDIGEMDPLDAWEAELEENIKRADLTWQERANATAQLMELRKQQAEVKGTPQPTVSSIAQEILGRSDGYYHGHTRQELVLSKHLDDPDVAGAATPEKAMKVLRRKEDNARNVKLAAEVGKIAASDMHKIYHADSEQWITTVPDGTYDVILTDPPYGMDADQFGDSGGMAEGAHGYADSAEILARILKWMPAQIFRVAKPQAHAYLFCDFSWFGAVKGAMEAAGWKVFRTPFIWHKPSGFRAPWPDQGPQRRYEICLYAVKGDKHTAKLGGDVITAAPDENLGNAAQKPVALYVDLLSRSIIPGDHVLDLFAGSGTILPAAHALKCRATAVEMGDASYAICTKRLKELK